MPQTLRYAIITPARNEEKFIELTLKSMVAQTMPPVKWIIVSDGSTDKTDEIVLGYAAKHSWIELLRMPERRERHFAGKVYAFNAGYDRIKALDFAIVGNLDADVSFEPQLFEFLIGKMEQNPRLGLAGAPFREGGFQYDYRYSNIENVWGGCQLFRKECYEQIGGYMPLKGGCIDHVAVLSSRYHGWETRTFPEYVCDHHRTMGTAQQGQLKAKFRVGVKDHSVGNHPLWEFVRALYQMKYPPLLFGGVALGLGYVWAMISGKEVPLSPELVVFVRREQMQRIRRLFSRSSKTSHANTANEQRLNSAASSEAKEAIR